MKIHKNDFAREENRFNYTVVNPLKVNVYKYVCVDTIINLNC